ncbi:hypothetical protein C8A00DRAFT_17015, partial [Chaetomidium leptoderma]
MEHRVKPIRDCIETLFGPSGAQSSDEFEACEELYGRVWFKCTKPWCHLFTLGLETAGARQDHVAQHERPFRCAANGCYGHQIGFAKESDLDKHNHRLHSEVTPVEFPSDLSIDIFKVATEGKLEVIQDLVDRGTNVNSRNKKNSTPLFLAATAGHYKVCQWLLEHGAN